MKLNNNNESKYLDEKIILSFNPKTKISNEKNNHKRNIKFLFPIIIIIFMILIYYILFLNKKLQNALFYIKIFKILKNEKDSQLFITNKTNFYYIKRKEYLSKYHIKYDESKLETFQQKLNYLIIHESPEYKASIADKIKVHEYSKKILGKDICSPILKIYNNIDEINFNELPDKFVLKCNHGSGMNIFCRDKKTFNLEKSKKMLNNWINNDFGLRNSEFQYAFIKKKIFASPYLGDNIIDYEFFCFNGNPKFLRIQKNINGTNLRLHNYYNFNWNLLDIETGARPFIRDPKIKIPKPKNLNLMIDYATQLSKEFVFLRVDLYEINDIVYLSELTFSPTNTMMKFKNKNQSLYLGSLMDISKIKLSLFNK